MKTPQPSTAADYTAQLERRVALLEQRQARVPVNVADPQRGAMTYAASFGSTVNVPSATRVPLVSVTATDPGYAFVAVVFYRGVNRSPSGGGRTDIEIQVGDTTALEADDGPSGNSVFALVVPPTVVYPIGGALTGAVTFRACAYLASGSGDGQANSGKLTVVTFPADAAML